MVVAMVAVRMMQVAVDKEVDMVAVRVMEMAVVQIVDVITMLDRSMAAGWAMLVRVVGVTLMVVR